MKKYTIQGFTLIELLVVIAIIGILTSLVAVNFIGVRQKGRDAERKSDLRQIQSALEFWRSDLGVYAPSLPGACNGALTSGSPAVTYMQQVPCDPLDTTTRYSYSSPAGNLTYCIRACLENPNDPERDAVVWGGENPTFGGACAATNCAASRRSFTVRNP